MSSSIEPREESAPPAQSETVQAISWLWTNNPFYVISAGLFLAGLWVSCDPENAKNTWALMAGLIGYTLLMAATGFLLVRFAQVWDDARTVLLLVVLMFLATSVTFDRALVFTPLRGLACNLAGLGFAILLSETLLRGIGLALPAAYRVPYYLLLGLFFLYPAGLALFLNLRAPRSEPVMWGMFGFSTLAGLILLTLLPAVRLGAAYMRSNDSPWPWPYYPWSLLVLLALAAPARAILLCYSMHLIDVRDLYEVTFGFYFLTPFGLAIAALLLEGGLVLRRRGMIVTALVLPVLLIVLSGLGHRDERAYREFLVIFSHRLGVGPVYGTMIAVAGFFAYAAARRAGGAVEALTATLASMMCVAPEALGFSEDTLVAPQQEPLMAAATLLLGLGIWRCRAWECLAGALGLTAGVAILFPMGEEISTYRWPIVFHLGAWSMLAVGASFEDTFAHGLRFTGSFLLALACLGVMFLPFTPPSWPAWAAAVYPLIVVPELAGYGYWLGHRYALGMGGILFAFWTLSTGVVTYRVLRQLVNGLDYLALSAAVFVVALLISLGKAGLLTRWYAAVLGILRRETD